METKFVLFTAFAIGAPVILGKRDFKVINKIEREDGSNRKYNVEGINPQGETMKVFIETID